MNYYHNQIVEKSWQQLIKLKKRLDFILIGDWAIYLYTKSLKSKDIDIIINFNNCLFLTKDIKLIKTTA